MKSGLHSYCVLSLFVVIVSGALMFLRHEAGAMNLPLVPIQESVAHQIQVTIECGDQLQIDQAHQLTLTISNGETDIEVKPFLPAQSTVVDAAHGLSEMLSIKLGLPEIGLPVTGTGKTRLISLPPGWRVKSVKTEVFSGKKWQTSNPHTGHLQIRSSAQAGAVTPGIPVLGEGVIPHQSFFSSFTVSVTEAQLNPIVLHLTARVHTAAGAVRMLDYNTTYANDTTIEEALDDLEFICQTVLGAATFRPESHVLQVIPNASIGSVDLVIFGTFADNNHEEITDPETDVPPWTTETSLEVAL